MGRSGIRTDIRGYRYRMGDSGSRAGATVLWAWSWLLARHDRVPLDFAGMAKVIGVTPRTARRHLDELVAAGWMTIEGDTARLVLTRAKVTRDLARSQRDPAFRLDWTPMPYGLLGISGPPWWEVKARGGPRP